MKAWLNHLIKHQIIDFKALVLRYYAALQLTADEAIALVHLQALKQKKVKAIQAERLAQRLQKPTKETQTLLNQLIDKGFLHIGLQESEHGKQEEYFHIDFLMTSLTKAIENDINQNDLGLQKALIEFIETTLQKPIMPKDYEYLKSWLRDETISEAMIKKATLDVMKQTHPSFAAMDRVLLKMKQPTPTPTVEAMPDVLVELKKLWQK
jgi:DNA replication protein DnaD